MNFRVCRYWNLELFSLKKANYQIPEAGPLFQKPLSPDFRTFSLFLHEPASWLAWCWESLVSHKLWPTVFVWPHLVTSPNYTLKQSTRLSFRSTKLISQIELIDQFTTAMYSLIWQRLTRLLEQTFGGGLPSGTLTREEMGIRRFLWIQVRMLSVWNVIH